MFETGKQMRQVIPEETMLARLAQSEQMRDFFVQMWMQNPDLAKQGGANVQNLLAPLEHIHAQEGASAPSCATKAKQRGISLIELIMFIVIVSTALAGILLVMNQVTGHSADTLLRKQALAAAESLLEEIELQDFFNPAGGFTGAPTQANRANFDDVWDYNGFTTAGIFPASGVAVPGLGSYNVAPPVAVVQAGADLGVAAASAVRITVSVTDPAGQVIEMTGYRTAY